MAPVGPFYFYLTLVRHAQTKENLTQIIQGHNDTLLTPFGEQQASEVGKSLKNLRIDQIFTSDLKRSSSTAKAIQKAYTRKSLSIVENCLMRERNFGLNNGKPRSEIHEFIAAAKASHKACQMWREVQGECSHQIFWRAINFFFELCDFVGSRSDVTEPNFPTLCSIHPTPEGSPLPVLLPLRQPPIPQAFKLTPDQYHDSLSRFSSNINDHQSTPPKHMNYKGHIVLVSHGQWIREFNYIFYALAEQTCGFPMHRRMAAVLSNCQFNQFGVAVDYERLAARVSYIRTSVGSALVADSLRKSSRSCPYDLSDLAEELPIATVCYHARVDANTVEGATTSNPPVIVETRKEADEEMKGKSVAALATAASVGSGVETLYFAREDDEYAGLPEVKKSLQSETEQVKSIADSLSVK